MPSRLASSIMALAYRRAAAPPFTALLPCHGLQVNSCQHPHTPLHQHTAWYLATEEALGKAGNVPEFPGTGELTLAYFANACQFTPCCHQVPQPGVGAAAR